MIGSESTPATVPGCSKARQGPAPCPVCVFRTARILEPPIPAAVAAAVSATAATGRPHVAPAATAAANHGRGTTAGTLEQGLLERYLGHECWYSVLVMVMVMVMAMRR